ncbi:MAG: PEGA domain-containing protein [Nannocystaceae bacterium]
MTARFVIQSRPVANTTTIDGRAAGTTPFDDALGLGRHSVRISARGCAPWEGTIDVASEGNVPLSVQLRGKGPGRSDEPDTPTTTPTPTPTPDKPTPPGPGGGETPPPASGGTGKKDPFLPTKKGDDADDVFLPVKKAP